MRILLFLFLSVFLLSSCAVNDRTMDEQQKKNIAVAQSLFDHFNKHEWGAMAELYADSALFLDPSFGTTPVRQSRRQVEEKYAQLNTVFPDIRDDIQFIGPVGNDRVLVEFISSGTQPDGSKMTLPICTIFTIEGSKIVKDFTYYDL